MAVIGADGVVAGVVTDVWIDRSEVTIRYLQLEVTAVASTGPLLAADDFRQVDRNRGTINVKAILASQFANVPAIASPDQITLREEDRICAYLRRRHALCDAGARGVAAVSEHEVEPIRGLPELLPQGERILWQGAPGWMPLAAALHVQGRARLFRPAVRVERRMGVSGRRFVGAATVDRARGSCRWRSRLRGSLGLYAWLTARSSVYTITNRRVVLRFGVALPMTMNVPFAVIATRR